MGRIVLTKTVDLGQTTSKDFEAVRSRSALAVIPSASLAHYTAFKTKISISGLLQYLVRAIEHLYDNAISAVPMNGSTGDGSEQQLDVFCHPPFSTFFSKDLCLMLWKNTMERLT